MQKYSLSVFILICGISWIEAQKHEGFGVYLGSLLRKDPHGLDGKVYAVDQATLQVLDFDIDPATNDNLGLKFQFSTSDNLADPEKVFRVVRSSSGPIAKPAKDFIEKSEKGSRFIVKVPGGDFKKWSYFGVISETGYKYIGAVKIPKQVRAPEPHCCLPALEPLPGNSYRVSSGPIQVLDEKTLKIPNFSFLGSRPPDGWIIAGSGQIGRNSDKQKVMILGRDTPKRHFPLREDYDGRKDVIVRLADGITADKIDFISVYCIAVGVDFGHTRFAKLGRNIDIPPALPPLVATPDIEPWARPIVAISPGSSRDVDLHFTLGPSGGEKAKAMRGVGDQLDAVWYVQGKMTPEIWVQKGVTYNLRISGGSDHPLYVTNEATGGYGRKLIEAQNEIPLIKNYAGSQGRAVGPLCQWSPANNRGVNPDAFDTFDQYGALLKMQCRNGQPFTLSWRPDRSTPKKVYYASYSTYNMGGLIRVCDRIAGSPSNPQCL